MTLDETFHLYAYALTERLMRRFRRYAVVNAMNDNRLEVVA